MFRRLAALPGFKATCTAVGAFYVLLGSMTLAQGASAILEPFAVPEFVLNSAHFSDFFHWLFVHMITIGILIALLGRFVEGATQQQFVARVLFLLVLHYTYLDIRTSVWGNNLYSHAKSLVPVTIDILVALSFALLSVRRLPEVGQKAQTSATP